MNLKELRSSIEEKANIRMSDYQEDWFADNEDALVDIYKLLSNGFDWEATLELMYADHEEFGQRTYYERFDTTDELSERFDRDWFKFYGLVDIYDNELKSGKNKDKTRDYIVNRLFNEHTINYGSNNLYEAEGGIVYYVYFT